MQPLTVDVRGRLDFDEQRAAVGAARLGCGFAYVFEQFAADELRSGTLVPVLEKFSPASAAFYVYYASRTLMPCKLRTAIPLIKAIGI